MSVNPLQGIQVINSVNPCSSTPSHQPPIHPYYYPAFPPPADPRPFAITATLPPSRAPWLPLHRRSILSTSLHPVGIQTHLAQPSQHNPPLPLDTLLEKVENCDYKRLSSPFLSSSAASLVLLARRSFFFPRFPPNLDQPHSTRHPAVARSSTAPSLPRIKTLTLCYPFSGGVDGWRR